MRPAWHRRAATGALRVQYLRGGGDVGGCHHHPAAWGVLSFGAPKPLLLFVSERHAGPRPCRGCAGGGGPAAREPAEGLVTGGGRDGLGSRPGDLVGGWWWGGGVEAPGQMAALPGVGEARRPGR